MDAALKTGEPKKRTSPKYATFRCLIPRSTVNIRVQWEAVCASVALPWLGTNCPHRDLHPRSATGVVRSAQSTRLACLRAIRWLVGRRPRRFSPYLWCGQNGGKCLNGLECLFRFAGPRAFSSCLPRARFQLPTSDATRKKFPRRKSVFMTLSALYVPLCSNRPSNMP